MPRCGCGGPMSHGARRCLGCLTRERRAFWAARRAPACRECGRPRANCPRGLCWPCYYTPGVRARHPRADAGAARLGSGVHGGGTAAPEPTPEPPGSEGKIEALAERARLGQALWSRSDATGEGRVAGEVLARRREPDAAGQCRARGRRKRRAGAC